MKIYAKKREAVRAAQWTGEMTPEMKELLGERTISIDGDRQLVFSNSKGPGRFACVGDWVVSFSGEDLTLVGADEFRNAYEEVAEFDVFRTPLEIEVADLRRRLEVAEFDVFRTPMEIAVADLRRRLVSVEERVRSLRRE